MKNSTKSRKPRFNVWKDPSPYGTYHGEHGNSKQWKSSFEYTINKDQATKIIKDNSPWIILGIPINSDMSTIKKAFHNLIKIHHPDKGGDPELCKKIIAAYVMLSEN